MAVKILLLVVFFAVMVGIGIYSRKMPPMSMILCWEEEGQDRGLLRLPLVLRISLLLYLWVMRDSLGGDMVLPLPGLAWEMPLSEVCWPGLCWEEEPVS